MEQVIYGDVFFIVNFSMDFLALFITSKLCHAVVSLGRLILGGVLGGLYATVALFLPTTVEAPLTLLFPFVLAMAVFGLGKVGATIKKGLLLFAVSFVMGGVMTAVYYFAGRFLSAKGVYINGEVETVYSELPLWAIGLCAVWAAFIASLFTKYAKKKAACASAEVTVHEGEREISFHALCDSGNFLEEPLSHLSVIVVGKDAMRGILPPTLTRAFFAKDPDFSRVAPQQMTKIRFIPITTVGHEGLMRGYIPDYVTINGEKKRACLAYDETQNDFDGFDAIMPPSLL